ncbi:YopJ family acetyltransferase [Yersinia ruckeri]|uniref:YopJ family acetyltransferase n=1 Tax=Yersinia ruckeri TaxID=29486 RepID=UPI001F1D9E2B|nr:YopJ family acetyltransferase [Yersinia ruckeri]UIN02272.1 hypothetical protein LGL91_08095 [Yersinia ruckeri]
MFGRIGSSHTLSQAILLKANNKDVTGETLNKIANKIISIKNTTTPMQRLLRINPRTPSNYAANMNDACNSLQKIKNHMVYEKISKVLGEHSAENARSHTQNLLNNNVQSNSVSNIFDTLTLPLICKSESNNINKKIVDFSCLDSLFRYIKESPDGNFKAITKMAKMDNFNEGHYTCIDVLKKGSKLDLVVYEPAYLQANADAGPDYGVKCLRKVLAEQFNSGKMKPEDTRIGVIEMGIQKSPNDCAIFSVSTAKNLYKNNDISELMFSKLKVRGEKFNRFYESTAKKIIIDPKNIKQKVDLAPLFLKHSTSKSGVILTNVKNEIVNKKGENIQQRIERNYKSRDGVTYSNSIELKRDVYLWRLNGQKQ